jgi:hypothetical protein
LDVLAKQGIDLKSLVVAYIPAGGSAFGILSPTEVDLENRLVVTNQSSIDGEWTVVSNSSFSVQSPTSGSKIISPFSGFVGFLPIVAIFYEFMFHWV